MWKIYIRKKFHKEMRTKTFACCTYTLCWNILHAHHLQLAWFQYEMILGGQYDSNELANWVRGSYCNEIKGMNANRAMMRWQDRKQNHESCNWRGNKVMYIW